MNYIDVWVCQACGNVRQHLGQAGEWCPHRTPTHRSRIMIRGRYILKEIPQSHAPLAGEAQAPRQRSDEPVEIEAGAHVKGHAPASLISCPARQGMRAAEAFARWHLGDRGWAGLIINAYLNPESVMENLRREMADRGAHCGPF